MVSLLEIATEISAKLSTSNPQIQIILVYGSVAREADSNLSDLDMITLFSTEIEKKQYEVYTNLKFMFENHPIDAWVSSFEKLDQTLVEIRQSMWLYPISGLLDCKILYCKNQTTLNRFKNFQKAIKEAISDHSNNIALVEKDFHPWDIFYRIKQSRLQNDLVSGRYAVWELIFNIITVYARLNDSFLKKNWGANTYEAFRFSHIPSKFKEKVEQLVISEDWDQILSLCEEIAMESHESIKKEGSAIISNAKIDILEEFIGFLEYLNKVRVACNKKDSITASYASSELQLWIADRMYRRKTSKTFGESYCLFSESQEHYFSYGFPDLIPLISRKAWDEILDACDKIEEKLHEYFQNEQFSVPYVYSVEDIPYYFSKSDQYTGLDD